MSYRKPTFFTSNDTDLFGRLDRGVSTGYLYPGDPGFDDNSNGFFNRFMRRYRRAKQDGEIAGMLIMLGVAVAFIIYCWFLATGDLDLNSCGPGSQRVHGFQNGHYVNLCIEPAQ